MWVGGRHPHQANRLGRNGEGRAGACAAFRSAARRLKLPSALACALVILAGTLGAQSQATYLHTLADFGGPLRYDGVRISVDEGTDEAYIIYQNIVHIFNPSGMEIFSFGDDLDLGQILDVAADKNGDILVLSYKDSRSVVTRCNYRGAPIGPIEFRDLPAGLVFGANRMLRRGDLLYFASLGSASVIVTDTAGAFKSRIEFMPALQPEERKDGVEAFGFAVDADGSIFVTMPTLFRVFKRSADGTLSSFGRAGSQPGRFGIVAGIASDRQGNLYVTDKLKGVVMVFDKAFNFIMEFGYRGSSAGDLTAPDDIAIDRKGRVYVSQYRRKGVSVFSVALR